MVVCTFYEQQFLGMFSSYETLFCFILWMSFFLYSFGCLMAYSHWESKFYIISLCALGNKSVFISKSLLDISWNGLWKVITNSLHY